MSEVSEKRREQYERSTMFMDKILEEDVNYVTIPEYTFRTTILPMMLDPESKDYTGWIKIARKWDNDIRVHDNNDVNKIIFTAPSLVGRISTPRNDDARDSAYEHVMVARRKFEVSTDAGLEYLSKHLSHRAILKGSTIDKVRMWNTIFEYYGYTDHVIDIKSTADDSEKQPSSSEVNIEGFTDV